MYQALGRVGILASLTLLGSDSYIFDSYTGQMVTEAEFNKLPPRIQEHVKRTAAHNNQASGGGWGMYYSPAVAPNRYKRVGTFTRHVDSVLSLLICPDWLRERIFFETLRKNDQYAISRLGFKAPNIFIMDLLN